MTRTRIAPHRIVAGALAALAAGLILFVTAPYGPGASGDSVTYLSVAESLAEGDGWVRFDGRRYVAWPPLYPLGLAAGVATGWPAATAARALGALAFAATVALLVLILARVTGSAAWAAFGGGLALLSPTVIEIFATALSEGLFTAWVTLVFWLALRAGTAPRPRDALLLGLAVGGACLTRYLGVVLAAAVGAWLVALPAPGRERLRRGIVFAGAAGIGPLLWLLRNLAVSGTAAGSRGGAYTPLLRNAEQLATGAASMLGLDALGAVRPWLAALLVLGLAGAGLVRAWRARPLPPPIPALPAAFAALYAAALVVLASWTPVSPLFELRFAVPLWSPLVLLVTVLAAELWERRPGRAARGVLAAGLALVLAHGLAAAGAQAAEHRARGVHELGRAEWHASALLDAVRSRDAGATLLTNKPHGVWLHTRVAVDYAPRRQGFRSARPLEGSVEALRARVEREGRVPLAWFRVVSPGYRYYAPAELRDEGFCLLPRDRFDDGVYFEVAGPGACAPGAGRGAP